MSEKSRKNFSSQAKAKVALEAVRGVKTVNEIAQEFDGTSVVEKSTTSLKS